MTEVVPFLFETKTAVRVVMIDGNPWFVAADVCAALGLEQVTRALDRLDDDEKQVIEFSALPNSKGVENQTLNPGQKINIIDESGLYSLILTSRKPEAKRFKKWITKDVIPSIRKQGGYAFPEANTATALATHTRRDVQIKHSKLANAVMIALGGRDRVIQYNLANTLFQSGKTPAQWKQIGKDEGLKAHRRTSGKEVLRAKHPHIACGLSLADHLVAGGANETDSISIGKDAQPIFKRILALGMTPAELLI